MLLVERNFTTRQDDAMEGPNVHGFELFSFSAGLKANFANGSGFKADSEKLKLEPFDLSLSLPNVSVPAVSHSVVAAPPSSPPHVRSV